jgi:hypothetical protein
MTKQNIDGGILPDPILVGVHTFGPEQLKMQINIVQFQNLLKLQNTFLKVIQQFKRQIYIVCTVNILLPPVLNITRF